MTSVMAVSRPRPYLLGMTIDIHRPIGDLTCAFPALSREFERLGIDYCCQGKRSLRDACALRGLNLDEVVAQLERVQGGGPEADQAAPIHDVIALTDYIERTHHAFTRSELARLAPLAEKVRRVHGERRPELIQVERLLQALAQDLELHMFKEEQILFPHIRRLALGIPQTSPFGTLDGPLQVMHHEHERMGSLLEELAALTDGYRPPVDACASYRALYDGLAALQSDLHQHVHLENNMLFPQAERLQVRTATWM
jgi:regulator of cell morphogenesis and NO signaling